MDDNSKANIQIEVEQLPEQKEAGSVFSVIAEAYCITKLNLFLLFCVILIALQLPGVDLSRASIQFKHEWGLKTYWEHFEEAEFSGQEIQAYLVSCALHLKSLYALGFQIIVLIFIKHYSNRLRQLEPRQSSKNCQ